MPSSFYDLLRTVVGRIARLLCRFEVEGEENLPEGGGYIIASNHLQWSDPILLQVRLPVQIAYVAKIELFRFPVLGRMMVWAEQIPLDRKRAREREVQRELKEQATDRVLRGQAVGIFPEGTRSKNGKLQPFMGGAVSIASTANRVIVPVGIVYSRSGWRHKLLVRIVIGQPIETAGRRTRDLTKDLERRIAALSGQEIAGDITVPAVL